MENFRGLLDSKLLTQPLKATLLPEFHLENAKLIAQLYMRLENCISVLSDMKARRSYIYYGSTADQLGLPKNDIEIESIWEDNLLSRVHPEDLKKKYRLELQFFQRINAVDVNERVNYEVITKLRTQTSEGKYILLKHRLLYINSSVDGSIWLALCLYSKIYDYPGFSIPEGVIINKLTGTVMDYSQDKYTEILSAREKEILLFIKHGYRSKEIADKLSLSINTVNRHRQNIFQKLNVNNSLEACRVAEAAGLF